MNTDKARFVWYSGRPSLDFVNTRRDREGAGAEYLASPGDLAEWLDEAGEKTGRVDEALLAEAIGLREAIDAGVRAARDGSSVPEADLRTINHWLATLPGKPPKLHQRGGLVLADGTDGGDGPRRALARLALDAARLLTEDADRLRVCPGEGCHGRFLDTSPAGRRRWCSMAVCGNRRKAAEHRRSRRPSDQISER